MPIPRPFDLKSQGAPTVGADIIDALVWANTAFGGTSDVQTVAGGNKGGFILFNPTSTWSFLLYGLQISVSVTANVRVGLVTVTTGYTQTGASITAKHFPSGGAFTTPQGQVFLNTNASALTAGNFFKALIIASGSSPFQFFGGYANVVLRPSTGLAVVVDNPTTFAVAVDWVEYQVK